MAAISSNKQPNLLESGLYHLITHYQGAWVSSAYTLLQTALTHKACTDPKLAQQIHQLQLIFNLANVASLCWSFKKIINNELVLREITKASGSMQTRGIVLLATGLFTSSYFAISTLNKYFQPYQDPNSLLKKDASPNTSIAFTRPFSQHLAQHLLMIRIVFNTALAYLSSNRVFHMIDIVGDIYSLMKISQLKWLKFSRIFHFPAPYLQEHLWHFRDRSKTYVKSATISYSSLLLNCLNPEGRCALCLEEKPNSYFCSWHSYHDTCLIRLIEAASERFDNNSSYQRTDVYENGIYKRSSYKVSLKQENLPRCPQNCEERYPAHAYFHITVEDADKGHCGGEVIITDQQLTPKPLLPNFLASLNLIYTVFQTALASMQSRHPELASQILQAQRFLLFADIAALARDCMQLYERMIQRLKMTTKELLSIKTLLMKLKTDHLTDKEKKILKGSVYVVTSFLGLSILSTIGVRFLNQRLKPTIDLKEVLQKATSLSPQDLQNINIFWDSPLLHQFGQWLSTSRIIVNLALVFFSTKKQSLFHLTTAAAQSFTLFKSFQLSWIKFEKTFLKPHAPLWSTSGDQKFIKQLLITSHCLLQPLPEGSIETSHLPSSLKFIYEYCTNFFNNSRSWYRYWMISRTNGAETSRRLMYDVIVEPSPLQPTFNGIVPSINHITARALDISYGFAIVNIIKSSK